MGVDEYMNSRLRLQVMSRECCASFNLASLEPPTPTITMNELPSSPTPFLLIVYLHGFKGDDTTFRKFPVSRLVGVVPFLLNVRVSH